MSSTAIAVSPISTSVAGNPVHRWLTYGTVLLADAIAFVTAGTVAVFVRYLFHARFAPGDWLSLAPCILLFFVVFAFSGLYPSIGTSPTDEFRLILRASSTSFLLLIVIGFFLREAEGHSRIVLTLAWLLTVVFVPLCRRVLRGLCARHSWWGISTVILGEPKAGAMMLNLLLQHPRLGLRPVALLTDGYVSQMQREHVAEELSSRNERTPRVFQGSFAHAHRYAEQCHGGYALVAMPNAGSERLREVIGEYACSFRNVLVIPDLFGIRSLSVTAKDICGVLTLKLDQRLVRFMPRFYKRCFDLVIAAGALVLLSPIMLALCIAVRLSSKGPVFYGQKRIGRNAETFRVWKFRSMRMNADQVLREHLDSDPELQAEWARDHKLKSDPRVTGIGRLLRKTSVDELPQLWNVLCGSMSLVGPRPIVQAEIAKYGECFEQYQRVRPGVTGLWQVSGRNNTTYARRTEIDNYYVRNWSLSLDTYILLRTVKTILFSEGAY